jgi:ectoine hydroxylase-related dioxygenase (phytanoyl-CoA dioxygenase family)
MICGERRWFRVPAQLTEVMAKDGFDNRSEVLAPDEVGKLLKRLSDPEKARGRAGMRHLMCDPMVKEVAEDARLVEVARFALGGDVLPFRATLFDKSADANWLVVWHQDTVLPLRERNDHPEWGPWSEKGGITYAHAPGWALEQVIALRVHLDDSTRENGPLRVLPGTHCNGVLSDDAIAELVREIRSVECTVSSGGIVAMRPLIVHASSKTESLKPRRVLHIEYATRLLAERVRLAIA